MTTTILLIRHGETLGNRDGMFRGQKDFPLNENGRTQARSLAEELSTWRIDAIYSSPLSRAMETARPLAEARVCRSSRKQGSLISVWEIGRDGSRGRSRRSNRSCGGSGSGSRRSLQREGAEPGPRCRSGPMRP